MTTAHSVARADQQYVQQKLRITEVTPAFSAGDLIQERHSLRLLRAASLSVQQAWRWLESKRVQQLSSRRIRLAETISLGEKRSISIVQVDGSQFLIGCSAGAVQLLAVLDKQDSSVDEIERAS